MSHVLRAAVAAAAAFMTFGAAAAGVDPNTYRVGHPASPRWIVPHAGQDHPAVQVLRAAHTLDPNQYRVQPPASTHWVAASGAGVDQLASVTLGGVDTR